MLISDNLLAWMVLNNCLHVTYTREIILTYGSFKDSIERKTKQPITLLWFSRWFEINDEQLCLGELNLPILKLAATEIVSGISGESESRLRDLFDQAMAAAPCLLFIDEIDAITQRRDQSNKGNKKIFLMFLFSLCQIDSWKNDHCKYFL